MKILVVEDDLAVAQLLELLLTGYNYAVDQVGNGEAALQMADAFEYDLVILDSLLPQRDGVSVCQQLRKNGFQAPILFLTGQAQTQQKTIALNAGADDYLVKPFDSGELMARVQALLRRGSTASQPILTYGHLSLDPNNRRVSYGIHLLSLTPKEYAILELFLRHPATAFNASAILDHVWPSVESPGEEAVRSHIKELRQKLIAVGAPKDLVQTVHRVGYRLNALYSSTLATRVKRQPTLPKIAELRSVNEKLRATLEQLRSTQAQLHQQIEVRQQIEQQLQATYRLLEQQLVIALQQSESQAEPEIREQSALLDIASDAIFVRDLDHRILYWNQGAERLYGWSAEAALGQNAQKLLQEKSDQISDILQTVLERGEWHGEIRKVTQSGQSVIVEGRWTLVRDERGQPQSILTVNTDITEKKQLESQFLRAQRLESIGTLATGIAHDLNNVFTPILASSQLLLRNSEVPEERSPEMLQLLVDSARRGANLTQQILAFARGTPGEPILLQVKHLLLELCQLLEQTFPKSIKISKTIPTYEPWQVCVDPTQLHQVLMNLCVNARDAMPNGGTLMIAAENVEVDASFARLHFEAQVGAYVKVVIADTGTGIPPEIFDLIFDPFFTTKEPAQGTGLGLSTARTIVKNHGGFMDVMTQVGQGTRFEVYLPALQ